MDKKNIFRQNLVARRKEMGLTQDMLAQRMNVSPQAVSKWENSSYPDPELLPLLAKSLNTSIDSLFGIKNSESELDMLQMIHDRLQTTPPEKRSELMMQIFYALIYAYNPSFITAGQLHDDYDKETFAGVKTDHEITLARLNSDLRYFMFLENPENGVNGYFTNTKNMARLLRTLADEDSIRIISYLGSGRRNKMHSVSVISHRLDLPEEKVQYVIDRLDRLGLVWRVCVDLKEGETIMYGYTHNQALTMILVLAESICNYFQSWDPSYDVYSYGVFKDETGRVRNSIPEVSWWGEDEE
ncbi:MAG: helix-turn-helix transcriptional regulator [Ruminococcus sp.]|nr:helix-turn-helix transcriptional regulator [Ruminococcus sp.]